MNVENPIPKDYRISFYPSKIDLEYLPLYIPLKVVFKPIISHYISHWYIYIYTPILIWQKISFYPSSWLTHDYIPTKSQLIIYIFIYLFTYVIISLYSHTFPYIWDKYNISLTSIEAILGWFPLLTMTIVRWQWGRCNLPRYIPIYSHPRLT